MKRKILFFCAITILPSLIFAQDTTVQEAPQDQTGTASSTGDNEDTSGFRERLIDFNVLGEGGEEDILKMENWNVHLNSSSDYLYDRRFTYSKPVKANSGKSFLGFRAHFPKIDANSYAVASPRFSLNFYNPESGAVENAPGKGVITNVGAIRGANLRIAGRNFPHKAIVNIVRNTGEEIDMRFGSLLFAGWKVLRWNNPGYLADFRDRESYITPLYPRLIPSVRFENLIIFRQKDFSPGNFITYIDWIDITFDKYYAQEELDVITKEEDFINDEDVWKIIQRESGGIEGRLLKKKILDFQRLERLERLKMNLPPEGAIPPDGAENILPAEPLSSN